MIAAGTFPLLRCLIGEIFVISRLGSAIWRYARWQVGSDPVGIVKVLPFNPLHTMTGRDGYALRHHGLASVHRRGSFFMAAKSAETLSDLRAAKYLFAASRARDNHRA